MVKDIFGMFGRVRHRSPRDYGLESFKNGSPYDIDLQPYFRSFLKNDWHFTEDFKEYLVFLSYGFLRDRRFREVYRDGEYTFVLVRPGRRKIIFPWRPIYHTLACIGFVIDDNNVTVVQIQRVSGSMGLESFRWEKMLLKIVIDWAKENGFTAVKVIRCQDSAWFNNDREKRMYLRYDVTARRMNFRFDPEEKKYVLSLT